MTDSLDLVGTKVLVVPCSGIGKAMGSIGREAAYAVVEDLRPDLADTLCLSLLVMGDEEARGRVRRVPCVTIDGCAKECARRNVELAGGTVAERVQVMDVLKAHRGLKPKIVSELDEDGWKLAGFVAEAAATAVDRAVGSVARREVVR
jgi:uncharacterized metal-binding protein